MDIIKLLLLFILSQYLLKFILDPIKELKQLIAKIGVSLIYYANVSMNLGIVDFEERIEFRNLFRDYASTLDPLVRSIPFYYIFWFFFRMPIKKKIIDSAKPLMGLSNTAKDEPIDIIEKKRDKIRELLNV